MYTAVVMYPFLLWYRLSSEPMHLALISPSPINQLQSMPFLNMLIMLLDLDSSDIQCEPEGFCVNAVTYIFNLREGSNHMQLTIATYKLATMKHSLATP